MSAGQGIESQPNPHNKGKAKTVDIQNLTPGQAVEYYAYNAADFRWTWEHGHVIDADDHPSYPFVLIDTTMYDYRPQSKAVEPHKVRPATTPCTAVASCQGIYAHQPSNLGT